MRLVSIMDGVYDPREEPSIRRRGLRLTAGIAGRGRGGFARLSLVAVAAALIAAGGGSSGCDRAPSRARADTLAAQPRPVADATVEAAEAAPTAQPSAGSSVTPERIIEVVADKAAYPLPLAGAVAGERA